MRRMTALTALLLVLLLACACILPLGMPSGHAEDGPAQRADGSVLAVENRRFTSRIYTLEDGRIREIYEESRLKADEECRIRRVTAEGDRVLFLRTFADSTDWELVWLEDGQPSAVYRDSFERTGTITGLRLVDGAAWITAVGDNGTIWVYRWTESDGTALKLAIPMWWMPGVVTAEYDGTTIRATTELGDTAFLSPHGDADYTPSAAETPGPAIDASGMGWLLCKRLVLMGALALWAVLAAVLLTASAVSVRTEHLAIKLTAVGSAALLLSALAVESTVFLMNSASLGQAWQTTVRTSTVTGVLWLCATAVMGAVIGAVTAPVARLTAQMDRIAEGDSAAKEAAQGRDELSRMDRSMQMMCMSLSVREYESECTMRSYSRFVPERMAELLERPTVEEIRLGDNRRMSGNVGIFSVGNRDEARSALSDAEFVSFINHSFGIFHDSITENNGCAVSSGLRLSAMEALFPNAASDGVRAGLDFLGRLRPRNGDAIPTPRAAVILHKASFLYGIAGKEERLFPYISSSELDYLGTLLPEFDGVGVHIVATEAYWKQLEGCGFTSRYIGFVSGGERLGSYKLYEVLDAYPQRRRELQRGYDVRFQEAVNLFYRSDFYLARNLFSTLLRACPEDGVARWYLFACEHFFNQGGTVEPDYRLFGQS